jgi:hypothetical protein
LIRSCHRAEQSTDKPGQLKAAGGRTFDVELGDAYAVFVPYGHPSAEDKSFKPLNHWRALRESNPCFRRESTAACRVIAAFKDQSCRSPQNMFASNSGGSQNKAAKVARTLGEAAVSGVLAQIAVFAHSKRFIYLTYLRHAWC